MFITESSGQGFFVVDVAVAVVGFCARGQDSSKQQGDSQKAQLDMGA